MLFANISLFADTLNLISGWNAIGTNSEMTLQEIKNQLGNDLLMIQNPTGTKTYNSKLPVQVHQSFDKFEDGIAYWIKVKSKTQLTFNLSNILSNIAIDGTLHDSNTTYENYIIKVLTNSEPPSSTASNIILYFSINGQDKQLSVNANYPINTKFQIAAYNSEGQLVASSSIKTYQNESSGSLKFNDITISSSSELEIPPTPASGGSGLDTPPTP